FTAITLPVEYNASSRALAALEAGGYLRTEGEMRGARAVLDAAALTYVAALAMALAQLLRMLMLARSRED
ncbi:MAG TPA: zinc metallopeptidase, partial [Firmicutes bacterium]|nr:zinc metallopeptidase [Bacillota bacterium]